MYLSGMWQYIMAVILGKIYFKAKIIEYIT